MSSSKDQFPDPWDPNASNPSSNSEDGTDATVPEIDPSSEDFGLAELREMLGGEARTPQQPSEMAIEELEGLFPLEDGTSDANFDDLFASLGLDSAANQPVDESQPVESPNVIANFDVSAEEPSLDLFSAEDVSPNLGLDIPESESLTNVDPFTLEEPSLDLTAESQNLDFVAESPELDAPVELDAFSSPSLDISTPDVSVPDLLSSDAVAFTPDLDPDIDINDSAELIDPDVVLPGVGGVEPGMPNLEVSNEDVLFAESVSASSDLPSKSAEIPIDSLDSVEGGENVPFVPQSPSLDIRDLPNDAIADIGTESPSPIDLSNPNLEIESSELSDSGLESSEILEPLVSDTGPDVPEVPPVLPVPESTEIPGSINIPVAPAAAVASDSAQASEQDSGEPPLVGAGSGLESASASTVGRAGAVASSAKASSGAASTYKQLLGGRQQIAAFGLILAGMGGIAGYGWSKAGIDNPLGTDFSQPRIGLLADRNDESEQDDSASALDSLGIGGTDDGPLDPSEESVSTSDVSKGIADDLSALGGATLTPSSRRDSSFITQSEDDATLNKQKAASSSTKAGNNTAKNQVPPQIDISDVPPEHWAHPYVVAMYEQGIVPDFPDGKFQPDKPVTRAELAASIQRAFKDQVGSEPIPFSDISEGYWAKDAITHAVNKGFMSGYSDDVFEPEQRIPRYQVLVSLVSGLGLPKIEDPTEASAVLAEFPDVEAMPKWALGQVAASQKAKLIVGDPANSGTLEPNRPATRAEANAMIYQALVNAGIIEDTVQ